MLSTPPPRAALKKWILFGVLAAALVLAVSVLQRRDATPSGVQMGVEYLNHAVDEYFAAGGSAPQHPDPVAFADILRGERSPEPAFRVPSNYRFPIRRGGSSLFPVDMRLHPLRYDAANRRFSVSAVETQ